MFTVSVDASGNVTLDQLRAVVHPTDDPDESKTLSAANLVVLTATATDKDGDSASTPLNIGQQLVFKDDGPSITATRGRRADADGRRDATWRPTRPARSPAQFTPAFGADGAGATPVSYALSTPGGNSGLVDTATGQSGDPVAGRRRGRRAAPRRATLLVFTVSVDASGNVTLDQLRSVVHPTQRPGRVARRCRRPTWSC